MLNTFLGTEVPYANFEVNFSRDVISIDRASVKNWLLYCESRYNLRLAALLPDGSTSLSSFISGSDRNSCKCC